MADIRITDLVDPDEIRKLNELDAKLMTVLDTYTKVAKDLAQGLEINIKVAGDIDKLEKLLVDRGKDAVEAQQNLTNVMRQQSEVIANTTNTISRQLMEQERVNKTTRAAYTEQERVKKLLDQYHDTYENQIDSMIRINRQLEENKKKQKENELALKMGRMSASDFAKAQAELMASTRDLTQQKRTLNQIMTAEEKANQAVEGSYAQLSQQLELLKKAYKEMGDESKASDFGKEMEETIQNLDAHLKDMAADMGEFQRNVGNYAVANGDLKKKYDDLVGTLASLQAQYAKLSDEEKSGAQGQQLAASIEEVSNAAKETKQSIEEHNEALEEARRSLGETGGKTSSVKRDLKELVLEIANLTIEYQNLSEEEQASAEGQALADHIRDLTEQAGVLKDAISDTNQAISNAASDTRGFDQIGGALQLAIDGFGLATGAAEMLGISSEDLAEIQTKLQAAIAASNAMQSIQNTLQVQSAVMQGVNLVQTRLRAAAENLHTAAKGKGVIATAALTAAQWAFNAAANANPIGLLVVAITAAIAAVYGLVKAFQAFFGPSDEALENYQKQKQALEDMCEANDKLIESMKARGATEAELLNQSLLNKQAEKEAADALFEQAKELYDEDKDEYKEALEAKKKADEDFEVNKEDSLNYLLGVIHDAEEEEKKQRLGTYEYKRQLIQAELEQQKALALTLLAQEKITREVYNNLVASLDKAAQMKTDAVNNEEKEHNERNNRRSGSGRVGGGRSSGGSGANDAKKTADELKKAVQAGEDALLKIITDSLERQRQAENLSYQRKLKELQDALAKTKETQVQMRTALNNQIQGLEAEHQRKLHDLEIAGMERRQKANADFIALHLEVVEEGSQEEFEWKQKQLNSQRDMEYLALYKAERDKTLTAEQALEMRATLVDKYCKLQTELEEEYATKQVEVIQKKYADQEEYANTAMIVELNNLKTEYAKKLAAAKGNAAEQARLKEQFERESASIQEKYAIQAAQSAIAMIEEQLKTENLSVEEREELARKLAQAKAQLAQQVADAEVRASEEAVKADNEATAKRIANAQQWLQVAADSLNAINDLVSTIYDAKISKVEEEQEANTEAGEVEQERIAQMVEQNVITEEEGEARKRAAEDKTAKKNEELEKKKAKLKEKQAKFDKLNSIAQCGIATAIAIMNALQMQPFPVGIAMAAIAAAMGAVQLATIIATPLPKYAKGTSHHKGGPAIVGDGGVPEVITYGGNAWITPDKPTLVDLPAGASVIPDVSNLDESELAVVRPLMQGGKDAPKPYNDAKVIDRLDNLIFIKQRESRARRLSDIDSQLASYLISKSV
jgi:uncharacterized membrane protein YgcG